MFNALNYVIDRVRRVTEVDLASGGVNWTMVNIEDPNWDFTGESTDKNDAQGTLLARFDTAKGVTFSGAGSTLHLGVLAAQRGTEVQVGDTGATVSGKTFEVIKVVTADSTKTATLSYTPSTAPATLYLIGADKNIEDSIEIGTGSGQASISGKVITIPESVTNTSVGVLYEYTTTDAVKVVDDAESFAEAAEYIVDILAADVCNPSVKRAGSIVFPKAKLDNNISIDLTTEGTHPFSITALKDYCSDDNMLCYVIFNKE